MFPQAWIACEESERKLNPMPPTDTPRNMQKIKEMN